MEKEEKLKWGILVEQCGSHVTESMTIPCLTAMQWVDLVLFRHLVASGSRFGRCSAALDLEANVIVYDMMTLKGGTT